MKAFQGCSLSQDPAKAPAPTRWLKRTILIAFPGATEAEACSAAIREVFPHATVALVPTEFSLAPRVGQSASMVSGSMTLSFHAKKMGNQTAKILKAKGKLVGKIEHGGNDDTPDRLIGKMERKPDHVLNVQVHGANGLAKMDN